MQTRFPFAHTFSIVARDPSTGEMGVAVQSHWFSVGTLVPWGEAGVGIVATQSMVEPSYGPLGLKMMRVGKTANQALTGLLALDSGKDLRQVAMVDCKGNVAVHTGDRCIKFAGHECGEGFSVQANMMANPTVWPAMAQAYRDSAGNLAERLLRSLEAGQAAGGDIRGMQSAAILIVAPANTGRSWSNRLIDLRVEDHSTPLLELRRLICLHQAYDFMNMGDDFLSSGNIDSALESYRRAAELAPEILELPFWQAVTMVDLGRIDEAIEIFKPIFLTQPDMRALLQRLPAAGLLSCDQITLNKIITLT
ncbi:MAG TPA: DUF1028 domain-containing protein [Longilinea sp.]|nr:DUF1028 domain-containing protein [Longilinea sp.]